MYEARFLLPLVFFFHCRLSMQRGRREAQRTLWWYVRFCTGCFKHILPKYLSLNFKNYFNIAKFFLKDSTRTWKLRKIFLDILFFIEERPWYLKHVETPSVVMQMPQVKNVQYLGALWDIKVLLERDIFQTKKMPSVIGSEGGSNLHSAASGGVAALAAEKKSIKVLCSHCEKILVPIETDGELSSLELEQCIF